MGPRRGNTHPLPDSLAPATQPRSASPSSGFTQFLSKPSKWFSRSVSASKSPSTSNPEPRPSVSSARKHKISHPTDPRPILDNHPGGGAGGASRYVAFNFFFFQPDLIFFSLALSLICPYGHRVLQSYQGVMALALLPVQPQRDLPALGT